MTLKEKRALRKRKRAAKKAAKLAHERLSVRLDAFSASLCNAFSDAFEITGKKPATPEPPDDEDEDGDSGDG